MRTSGARHDSIVVFEKKFDTEETKIYAQLTEEGDLKIHGFDAGSILEGITGDDDYEYGMTIRKVDLGELASILSAAGHSVSNPIDQGLITALKEAFAGGVKFRDLAASCRDRGLEIQQWSY